MRRTRMYESVGGNTYMREGGEGCHIAYTHLHVHLPVVVQELLHPLLRPLDPHVRRLAHLPRVLPLHVAVVEVVHLVDDRAHLLE